MQPKINFDFTSGSLDARITFARALNTATCVNSNGNIEIVNADIPRFDYDPTTLSSKGLLIEQASANLLPYSNGFSDVNWAKADSSVSPNAALSPDGTNNAYELIENAVNSVHQISRIYSGGAAGVTYTFSVYIAKNTRTKARVIVTDNATGDGSVLVDLVSGTIATPAVSGNWSAVSAFIEKSKGDFYRVSLTLTKSAGGNTSVVPIVQLYTTTNSYQGDGSSGIFIYGAQLEAEAFPTSYIPTTTTSLTRNADVATITGTNFSAWWQAGFGGATVQALPSTVSGTRPLVQFDDGTANEIIALRGNTTNPELYIVDGGTPQAQIDAGTIASNTDYSLTGWWATNDCKARLDSGAVVTDTSATIPTVTQVRLGSDGTNYLNGHLASISYYDSFSEQIYTRRKNKAVFNLM